MNRIISRFLCTALLCVCAGPFAQTQADARRGRRFAPCPIACDKGKAAILRDSGGKIGMVKRGRLPGTAHDVSFLPNGNILMPISGDTIVEQTPDGKEVFRHVGVRPSPRTQVASKFTPFQRLDLTASL